ncbi:hypothetical protein [Pedobacter zeae]|uniref:Uncharacterized protein n=1 Tax=Pedobacter zeae TaxID=1737356 RepID=A0A7W6K7I0_9SPHI|nr:hypothetical protein [Pedobacter zeae]MBB4106635.1 hypothetical protein [Pedobacter zeae]GGH02868.1 hypothetical protein GCM10007422_17550 [Pedobacter zeae]
MPRGQKTLYTDIFAADTSNNGRKTRIDLLRERDEAIAYRYYFRVNFLKDDYDDALKNLESEFFISERMIIERLTPMAALVKQLKQEGTTPAQMRKKYPHYNWAA